MNAYIDYQVVIHNYPKLPGASALYIPMMKELTSQTFDWRWTSMDNETLLEIIYCFK